VGAQLKGGYAEKASIGAREKHLMGVLVGGSLIGSSGLNRACLDIGRVVLVVEEDERAASSIGINAGWEPVVGPKLLLLFL
jgi:hypothetical protein